MYEADQEPYRTSLNQVLASYRANLSQLGNFEKEKYRGKLISCEVFIFTERNLKDKIKFILILHSNILYF